MIKKLIGLALGVALLALLYGASLLLHMAFLSQARPPQAPSPGASPFALEVYSDAKVTASSLDYLGAGHWQYSWMLTSPTDPETLVAYYQDKYPQATVTGGADQRQLEVAPEGEGHDSFTLTLATPQPGATEMRVQVLRETSGFVPSLLAIQITLLLLTGAIMAVFWHALVHLWHRQSQHLQEPPDPATVEAWREPLAILEQSGFQNTFDYRVSSADFPNCARLLDRERQTLAILQFALLDKQPYTYLEVKTRFDDGSVVATTTNLYAGAIPRPEWYFLERLPQGTAAEEVLRRHEEAVAQRLAQEVEVVSFEPDALFDMWKEVRKECLTGAKGEAAALAETHDVVSRTSRSQPQAARPVKALSHKAFIREVSRRLRALDPDMEVTPKDGMNLHLRSGNFVQDLDTETVFFMCQNNPADVDKILTGFLARFARRH